MMMVADITRTDAGS